MPRIERMGVEAIAECLAAAHPVWVEGSNGLIWLLDPDGTRHVEERSADEVFAAAWR